jgi:hypothetical protein
MAVEVGQQEALGLGPHDLLDDMPKRTAPAV